MPSLLASLLVAAAVRVEGTTSCPDSARVEARLAEILPADGAAAASGSPDRGRFWAEGDELVVQLDTADGALLGTRRLPLTAACEDLAAAVAVSLAAWESDVHPQFAASLAARPPEAVLLAAPAEPPIRWRWELGAALGLGGALDGPAFAGDAVLDAWLGSSRRTFSGRAELEAQSTRTLVLSDGRALWRRFSLGLGVDGNILGAPAPTTRAGRLSWFALARLAWLDLRGEAFPQNHTTAAVDPGATAGMRWFWDGPGERRWAFGLELAASVWPVRHEAVSGATDATRRLPATEVFLRVGATLGAAP